METSTAEFVIVVDEARWSGFDQMAGALRRMGVRTVRVTRERSVVARAIDALAYDESHGFSTEADLQRALLALDRPGLLDVMVVDDLCQAVAEVPWRRAAPQVVEALRLRARWSDKLYASERLAQAGVPVPRVVRADEASADEAVARLGSPLVVKRRVGAGGTGVRVVEGAAAAARAVTELAADPADPQDVYFEEYADGVTACYAAAYADGVPGDVAAYVSHRAAGSALGPSSSVQTVDDEELMRVGAAMVDVLGGRGVVNADVVCAGDRRLVIDVNLRVWTAAVLLRAAGVAFDEAYLAALRGRLAQRPARRADAGVVLTAFPDAALHAVVAGAGLPLGLMARTGRPYLRWSGPRYVASAVLYTARQWSVRGQRRLSAVIARRR